MDRKRWKELLLREPHELTADELIEILTDRYQEPTIPPCRLCGGELSIQSIGGGKATEYACTGRNEDGTWKEGRKIVDDHYRDSRYIDYKRGGDDYVMELVKRYQQRTP
jgi:hypothetical protein